MDTSVLSPEEKQRILRTLEVDTEFRYAVAGLIGVSETLKRLDRIEDEIRALREDFRALQRNFGTLREDFIALRKDFITLREDFNKMLGRIGKVEKRLGDVERTLERLAVTIEDEAQDAVASLLSKRSITVAVSSLRVDEKYEFDIYASTGDLTVVGEAKVRASPRTVDRLLRRVEEARKIKPEFFKGKVVPALYCLRFAGDVVEAQRRGVWLIVSGKELTSVF
ncbi:hypothetical protein IG193_01680 [Infirmifilum lucidum]|uniref:DUF8196 domain-containing protein n=1 Tax=Infirmifilum lucidum TaxID=2776706 RepID=A0A7L9FH96_9CREN|nr:hypothetical protein [Infirmifilum lucidum]QOJ79198.1 hypothetical protein IG193_01680 [Infirmifilum lucidum]